jgi:hypothetical protein
MNAYVRLKKRGNAREKSEKKLFIFLLFSISAFLLFIPSIYIRHKTQVLCNGSKKAIFEHCVQLISTNEYRNVTLGMFDSILMAKSEWMEVTYARE